jgi:hypothetical protein
MNITGKTICYKNEYGYSTAISNKKQDGTYERMYISLQLPKGVEVENKTYIEITKGFLTFYPTRDGNKIPKIVAMEIKQDEPKQETFEEAYVPDILPF